MRLVVVITVSFGNAHSSEKGKYSGTKIYTKDSIYVSDSNHFYIGKTSDYYFIFNKKKKYATIIPERDVTKFELVENSVIANEFSSFIYRDENDEKK